MKLDTNLGKLDEAKRNAKRKGSTSLKPGATKPSKKKKDDTKT